MSKPIKPTKKSTKKPVKKSPPKAKKSVKKLPPYVKRLDSLLGTVSKSSRAANWAGTILSVITEDDESVLEDVVKILFKYIFEETVKNGITRGGSLASLGGGWWIT